MGQTSLFDLGDDELVKGNQVKLENLEPWGRAASLAFEKEVLGFYLTDHPLRGLETVGRVWGALSIEKLSGLENKAKAQVLGLVSSLREIITKKGTRMAFARVEDMSGGVELIVFPDAFKQYEMALKSEGAIVVSGGVEQEDGHTKMFAEQIRPAEDMIRQIKRMTLYG